MDAPFAIDPNDVLAQPTRARLFALLGELKRPTGTVELAVVGAHLAGEPLHHQLVELDAVAVAATTTTTDYRLYALAGTEPAKPGLVRVRTGGAAIAVEVYRLTLEAFGRFVAAVPPPLAIGTVRLASGRDVNGFVCEPVGTEGALDITAFGGWRSYRASLG